MVYYRTFLTGIDVSKKNGKKYQMQNNLVVESRCITFTAGKFQLYNP